MSSDLANRYRAIHEKRATLIDWYKEFVDENRVSLNCGGFKEPALQAIQRMLGKPPYGYSVSLLEVLLKLGRRQVYRQLEKLLISGDAMCVRIPKPDGGWSDWWSLRDAPTSLTSGSLIHSALVVSIGDWLRTHVGFPYASEVHDSVLEQSCQGSDLQIISSNGLSVAVEAETGLKHRWFSLDQAILEYESILRRNIGYHAILMVVPRVWLKTWIETIIGRREQRLTVMTVRELHSKFDPYYSDLWWRQSMNELDLITESNLLV